MAVCPERNSWEEPALIKGKVKEYWNERADSFRVQREAELKSGQHKIWEQELLSHLTGKDSLKILDVGCGCGFFSLLLAENGYRVTGIDLTENMILEGRQMAAQRGMEVAFLQMDAENLLFADETFDAIVSRNLTWTLPHPARAYEEWLRVLKPGGLLLNYDAEHARYHFSRGLEGEKAHEMLSRGQMEECMEIYGMLPISGWKRPDWDTVCLRQLGCAKVETNQTIGKRLFLHEDQFSTPYPVFRIKAVKE